MDIDNLMQRYYLLKFDTENTLKNAVIALGGEYHFITETDSRLEDCDDISELGLPMVNAYSWNYDNNNNYYVTKVVFKYGGVEIYGVDENQFPIVEDGELVDDVIDHVFIDGIFEILEKLPESK